MAWGIHAALSEYCIGGRCNGGTLVKGRSDRCQCTFLPQNMRRTESSKDNYRLIIDLIEQALCPQDVSRLKPATPRSHLHASIFPVSRAKINTPLTGYIKLLVCGIPG